MEFDKHRQDPFGQKTSSQDPSNQAPFGGLDPRTLLLAAAGAAICFSLIRSLALAGVCLALSLVLAVAGRPAVLPLLRRLALANFFILFIWLTVPLTVPPSIPGQSLFSLGPLSVSREGVDLALLVTLKCNAILLCFFAFIADLSLPLIGCALERLRVPVKLVFLFICTCRHIHVIGEEWQRLRTAAALRGFLPRTSPHTYMTIGNMLGLTVVNSMDRSRRVYEAMLLRGFNGQFHTVTDIKTTRRDFIFSSIFFIVLLGLFLADLYLRYAHA